MVKSNDIFLFGRKKISVEFLFRIHFFLFQSLFPINFNSVRSSAGMNPMEFAPFEVRLA